MEIWDKKYWAGFFDGEGSINLSGNSRCISLDICQKNHLGIFNEVMDLFGGSTQTSKTGVKHWTITGERAQIFLQEIYPYLRLKKEQAEIILDFEANKISLRGNRGSEIMEDEWKRRDKVEGVLRSLR